MSPRLTLGSCISNFLASALKVPEVINLSRFSQTQNHTYVNRIDFSCLDLLLCKIMVLWISLNTLLANILVFLRDQSECIDKTEHYNCKKFCVCKNHFADHI